MSLESATYASQLNTANPTSSDPRSEGDDHLRKMATVVSTELDESTRECAYTRHTATWISAVQFTIPQDETGAYVAGRRIKVTGATTGTVFGDVTSSTFSAATTINIRVDGSAVANEAITLWLHALKPESIPVGQMYTASLAIDTTATISTNICTIPNIPIGHYRVDSHGAFELSLTRATSISLNGDLVAGDFAMRRTLCPSVPVAWDTSTHAAATKIAIDGLDALSEGPTVTLHPTNPYMWDFVGSINVTTAGYVAIVLNQGDSGPIERAIKGAHLILTKVT